MMSDVLCNSIDEFVDRTKDSMAKPAFGDVAKETFHHIEPRGAGGREVNMETLVALHPSLDLRMFVRGVVIANDVNLFIRRRIAPDQTQEPDPFLMTMPRHTGFQD